MIQPDRIRLAGIATLLLDAARHDAPEREGVTTAARILEDIHRRLTQALSVKEAAR